MSSSLDDYPSTNGNSMANEVLEDEMKAEYYLCINQPEEYRKKVDAISDLFHLTTAKGNRLKSNDCHVYIVGHSNEYILVGLNPGYSAINNPVEEIEARTSWEHYLDFYQNKFFNFFDAKKFESPYYKSLFLLLSNLSNSRLNLWQFFDSHIINLELIPYHSEGIIIQKVYYFQIYVTENRHVICKID